MGGAEPPDPPEVLGGFRVNVPLFDFDSHGVNVNPPITDGSDAASRVVI